jgi:Cys-tRNA synthase (O-phospho-L-seryl-tRNA:Cys-tRNA synthase)
MNRLVLILDVMTAVFLANWLIEIIKDWQGDREKRQHELAGEVSALVKQGIYDALTDLPEVWEKRRRWQGELEQMRHEAAALEAAVRARGVAPLEQ